MIVSIDMHQLTKKKESFTYILGRKKSILQVNYPYIIAKTENNHAIYSCGNFPRRILHLMIVKLNVTLQVSFEVNHVWQWRDPFKVVRGFTDSKKIYTKNRSIDLEFILVFCFFFYRFVCVIMMILYLQHNNTDQIRRCTFNEMHSA